MYGPGPGFAPPQHHHPRSRAVVVLLRVIFALLPLLSIGFLSWVSMLRLAIMRRRRQDWALFWAELLLVVGCLVTLEDHFEKSWISDAGMATLLVAAAGVTVYFLVVDIRHHRTGPAGALPSPALPHGAVPGPYGPYAPPQPGPATHGYGYPPPHPHPAAPHFAQPPQLAPPQHPTQPVLPQPAPYDPPAPAPAPAPQQSQPPQRINQVRAELDELSDLLRREQDR
ncbi:hypothetical protein ACZ90_33955 [Streptomyces albus subsp. albus]|nr:hypothetical protein ACZ90_33955 [Streptomyces albus subsp. albus]